MSFKKIADYQPALLCMGLIRAPRNTVREALQLQLENTIKRKSAFDAKLEPISWPRFFEQDGLLFDGKRLQIALFSTHEDATVYVCNLADGWVSLYRNLIKTCAFDAFFFRATLATQAEYKVFEMMGWRQGVLKRQVRVLQDERGWNFVNEGDPMPFENPIQYKNRRVSARLDLRSIERYAEAAGYGMLAVTKFDDECWHFSSIG